MINKDIYNKFGFLENLVSAITYIRVVATVQEILDELIRSAPVAYCEECQSVGMSNCSDFTHCGQPKCVTCHQFLDSL